MEPKFATYRWAPSSHDAFDPDHVVTIDVVIPVFLRDGESRKEATASALEEVIPGLVLLDQVNRTDFAEQARVLVAQLRGRSTNQN